MPDPRLVRMAAKIVKMPENFLQNFLQKIADIFIQRKPKNTYFSFLFSILPGTISPKISSKIFRKISPKIFRIFCYHSQMPKNDISTTHPWISFRFEAARIPSAVWRQIGECEAMLRQIASTPMSGRLAGELYRLYLSKGAHATTAIEGNTLTEEEVGKQMRGELPLPASREYLRAEVDNILKLCDELAQRQIQGDLPPLTVDLLGDFNLRILRKTRCAEKAVPGEIRAHSVAVGGYRGAPAAQCRALLEKLCAWLRDGAPFRRAEDEHGKIAAGVLRAAFGHLYMAWIHPYGDGNGRAARMLEYLLLLDAGAPAPCAQLIGNHCNVAREEYYRRLQTARERDGAASFLAFAADGLREQLREQLQFVQKQLLFVVWQSYVGEKLGGEKNTETARLVAQRRRALAEALAAEERAVAPRDMPDLTPAISRQYATRRHMLAPDLAALQKLELVEKAESGYRARVDRLLRLTPRGVV